MTNPYTLFAEARQRGPNPFTQEKVISAQEVWGEVLTNISHLNQHIDREIHRAIADVRQKYSSKIGMAIKGERGTGKSHAIHRLWKQISRERGAVFAYIPPCSNPRRIDGHVRLYLSLSFSHQDDQKVTQWQRLAAALFATLKDTEFASQYQEYLDVTREPEKLRKLIQQKVKRQNWLDFFTELTECILEVKPELDYQFVKAVLYLILKANRYAQAALAWIKDEDNPDIKELLKLPHYPDSILAIARICQLAEVASFPVVICFDQLDSTEPDTETGDSPSQVVARCIDRLFFQCSNLVILCCVINDTWIEIQQMGGGIPERVSQRSVEAKPPAFEEMIELVRLRLNWFHQKHDLKPEDYPPLYPIEDNDVQKLSRESPSVRSLLTGCAKIFERVEIGNNLAGEYQEIVEEEVSTDPGDLFQDIYEDLLTKVEIPLKDDDKLAAILERNMRMLPQGGTNFVVVDRIETINTSSHDLNFIISGYDEFHKQPVKIGVRVCETTNGNTFNAVMKRLLDYDKYGLTRGCLVRSTPVPRSWKVGRALEQQLVEERGGEVLVLKGEEMNSLVAIEQIYEQAEDYGFTKEQVIDIVKALKLEVDNPLIRKILSKGTTES